MNDLISREALLEAIKARILEKDEVKDDLDRQYNKGLLRAIKDVKLAPAVDAEPVITGDTSDGYHTFNELYHHRAVLFSVIVKAFAANAWKARRHHDGSMYDGMFIVGIDTPDGPATYHYDIDPYWDMFECRELLFTPEWDGHTPAQAIERIGKLEPVRHGHWLYISSEELSLETLIEEKCSLCGRYVTRYDSEMMDVYCPNCGAKMDAEETT